MRINTTTKEKVFKCKKAGVEVMEWKGYELVEELFVDSSGCGLDSEPALTVSNFMTELDRLLQEHKTLTAKITNEGQFQVYIGLFKKVGSSTVKQVTPTVIERNEGNTFIVRLNYTDILKRTGNEYVLNSGGWRTVTTKRWINEYLPSGAGVFQRDYKWYVAINGKYEVKDSVPFSDGMSLIM